MQLWLCRKRSLNLSAGLQKAVGNGMMVRVSSFSDGHQRRNTGKKEAQTCSSYIFHLKHILSCFTWLTHAHPHPASGLLPQLEVPVTSLPPPCSCPRQRGGNGQPESTTSPATGMEYVTPITHLRKHNMDMNRTDLTALGPSVLPYISGAFPHPLHALHYLLHFI